MSAAVRSAETMAALRSAAAHDRRLAVRCDDWLAQHFLGIKFRLASKARPRTLVRSLIQARSPGSYCFAIVRTRHFDEVLRSEVRSGVRQVVVLGAGYDTRAYRFRDELRGVRVFEVDLRATQARKVQRLERARLQPPANVELVAIDFNVEPVGAALSRHGFRTDLPTLFLWEGVSYYLPEPAVGSILDFVGSCAPGSSILFDYALLTYVEGDTSTYGGEQVARWLRRIGEPFLFGLHPSKTASYLLNHNLDLKEDLGAEDLEAAYLTTTAGDVLGRSLGHVRIAHARVIRGRPARDRRAPGP